MGKTATVFKDIGKVCKDLIEKDFGVGKNTIEVKSKLPQGVGVTPKMTMAGDKVSGTLAAKYDFNSSMSGEVTFGTGGSLEMTLEAVDAIMKGLTLTAECKKAGPDSKSMLASADLIALYKGADMTCKATFFGMKQDLSASLSAAMGDLTAGIDCLYSGAKGTIASYGAACQFVQPEFIASAKCDAKGDKMTVGCGYYHKVSSDMQLGVALSKPMSGGAVKIDFGTQYKYDKDTTIKGKVDSDGLLSCSYKQKLSKLTTMTLAMQVDAVDSDKSKNKVGVALNFTP